MNYLMIYLLKTFISLAVFYAIFWLFLRSDTFFKVNRFYLLGTMIFSFIVPLFHFSLHGPVDVSSYSLVIQAVSTANEAIKTSVSSLDVTIKILFIVYFAGVFFFFFRFLFRLFQIGLLINKFKTTRKEELHIIHIDKKYPPFSFLNIIFLNSDHLNKDIIDEIVSHENIHIRQAHSIDLIITDILTAIQWFNPFIWFYRNSLKAVHEYLADEGVLLSGNDRIKYQNLLVNLTLGIQVNDLTNNFNHSLIKRRLTMMKQIRSGKMAKLKPLICIPVIVFVVFAFAFNTAKTSVSMVAGPHEIALQASAQGNDTIYQSTEIGEAPVFPGGEEARMKFFIENIKYPDEARKKHIMGTVYVMFQIDKNGRVINPKIEKGLGYGCDEEVLRVVNLMPIWKPGKKDGSPVKVSMVLPVNFKLGEKASAEKEK